MKLIQFCIHLTFTLLSIQIHMNFIIFINQNGNNKFALFDIQKLILINSI